MGKNVNLANHTLKVKPVKRAGAPFGNKNKAKNKNQLKYVERQVVFEQRAKATNFKGDLNIMSDPMLSHKIGVLLFKLNQKNKLHKDEVTEIWNACCQVMIVMHRWAASVGLSLNPKCSNSGYIPEYKPDCAEEQQTRRSLTPEQQAVNEFNAQQAYMNMETKAAAGMGQDEWSIFKDMCLERKPPHRIKELGYKFIAAMEI